MLVVTCSNCSDTETVGRLSLCELSVLDGWVVCVACTDSLSDVAVGDVLACDPGLRETERPRTVHPL